MARVNIGTVATDSGAFIIMAPEVFNTEEQRNEACAPTLGTVFGPCFNGAGFSFATGADGEYNISAAFDPDDGRIYSITIQLIELPK
jgi:hypothetical protein